MKLEILFREVRAIHVHLSNIDEQIRKWKPIPVQVPEPKLLQLPDHLRRTYMVVASKGEGDATQVSSQTGRCRAVESNYLNQLCRMGWLRKVLNGRMVCFSIALREEAMQ